MSHQGQCPACFQTHSFDDDQLASVHRCECGAKLFVCDARGFTEVPVLCIQCMESYFVEPEDIGHLVECECGAEIAVPDVVLRLPIKRDDDDTIEEQAESSAVVSCPNCMAEFEVDREDVGVIAECDCGITLVIEVGDDGLVAVEETEASSESSSAERSSASALVLPQPDPKPTQKASSTGASASKNSSWPITLGVLAVASFFLFAVGMFFYSRIDSQDSPATSMSAKRSVPRPGRPAESAPIEPGVLERLLAKVPVPRHATSIDALAADVSVSNQSGETPFGESRSGTKERSPFGGRTAKSSVQLPAARQARERIPMVPVRRPRLIFESAYQDAFESYEELMAMKRGDNDKPTEQYKTKLGETIWLTKNAYNLASGIEDETRRNELCYLLAYLSHSAGHLIEAAIYGEAAARWGDVKEAATHEAAMIALAAMQEANAIQWGIADQVGELDRMVTIAELIDQKWPDDPQRDAIWISVAQTYTAFGKPRSAAEAWLRLMPSSTEYPTAQLAAGSAYWSYFLDRASEATPDPKEMVSILNLADKYLDAGIKASTLDDVKPTHGLLSAKLTLAKIANRLGDSDAVVKRLTDKPIPLVDAISTKDVAGESNKLKVDASFARTVFELLYRAKSRQQDLVGANQALQQLADVLGGDQADELGRMYLGIATDHIARLSAKERIVNKDIETLKKLLEPLNSHDAILTAPNRLWIAESWATFAQRATSDELSLECYSTAAKGYADAMARADFPRESTQSARLRRAELLRITGNNREALEMIAKVLQTTPNAIGLQMQAALAQQQVAFEENSVEALRSTLNGAWDDPLQKAIWGWAKLTTTLHQLRFSDKGTPQHASQLIEAQFHLARCQWLLASVTGDPEEQRELTAKTKSHVQRLLATTLSKDSKTAPWRKGFERLLAAIESN